MRNSRSGINTDIGFVLATQLLETLDWENHLSQYISNIGIFPVIGTVGIALMIFLFYLVN